MEEMAFLVINRREIQSALQFFLCVEKVNAGEDLRVCSILRSVILYVFLI